MRCGAVGDNDYELSLTLEWYALLTCCVSGGHRHDKIDPTTCVSVRPCLNESGMHEEEVIRSTELHRGATFVMAEFGDKRPMDAVRGFVPNCLGKWVSMDGFVRLGGAGER